MTKYKIKKESARDEAIFWERESSKLALSYGDLAEAQQYFARLAKRYGLTKEFAENGII